MARKQQTSRLVSVIVLLSASLMYAAISIERLINHIHRHCTSSRATFNKKRCWRPSSGSKRPNMASSYYDNTLQFVASHLPSRLTNRSDYEEAKVVLSSSRWSMITRNLVHLLPSAAFVVLLWANLQRLYIGPTFTENALRDTMVINLIQFGTKMIELASVASLSTIVMHAMRHELLRDGIPLGLLGSGIWFSSISAFWSPTFLGSFDWKKSRPKFNSRWPFYLILIVCGLIAATIAPVAAILAIPQTQSYRAGGLSFVLPGTSQDMTPTTFTSQQMLTVCQNANATLYATCPSGGYIGIKATLSSRTYATFCDASTDYNYPQSSLVNNYAPSCQAKGPSVNREWNSFLVRSPLELLPPVLSGIRNLASGTTAMQPHAATSKVMQEISTIWTTAAAQRNDYQTAQYKWSYELIASGFGAHPFVRSRCSMAQNLSSEATQAQFAWLTGDAHGENSSWWNDDPVSLDHTYRNVSIHSLDRNPTSGLRAQWVSLPIQTFGDKQWGMTTNGMLIELPWSGNSRAAVACSIASSWHDAPIESHRTNTYGAFSVALSGLDFGAMVDSPNAKQHQTPILLTPSWLDLLTVPALPDINGSATGHQQSTIEALLEAIGLAQMVPDLRTKPQHFWRDGVCVHGMMPDNLTDTELLHDDSCGKGSWRLFVETILAMLVADGISRVGSQDLFEIQPDPTDWSLVNIQTFNTSSILYGAVSDIVPSSQTIVSRWIQIYVVGYAWNPESVSEYLAVAGAFTYLTVVLCFLIYTIVRKGVSTSTAWSSVTELVVLAQNSPPPDPSNHKLHNISAGISHMKTYRALVRVRTMPPGDDEERPKLRLVVVDDAASHASSTSDLSASEVIKMHAVEAGESHLEDAQLVRPARAYIRRHDSDDGFEISGETVMVDERYA